MGGGGRWASALRWPTAAALCGLEASLDWPAFVRAERGPTVQLPLRLHQATTQADVARAADQVRSLYGCARVEVRPDRAHGNRVTLALLHRVLPAAKAYAPLPSRPWPTRATRPLRLGTDDEGNIVSIPLFDPEVGGTSALIAGVPGTGKSTALRVLIAELAATNAVLAVIDPTGGSESSLWGQRLPDCVTDAEPEPTLALLHRLLTLIVLRGELLAAGLPLAWLRPVVLVCDELAELAAAGTPRQQDDARAALRRITALGRKANVAVLLATQRTTATSIDVTTRSLVAWRVALAHPEDPYGSEAVLGHGRHQASLLTAGDRGAAYVTGGGAPTLVRVFDLAKTSVSEVPVSVVPDLCELETWERAALRELRPAANL